MAAAVLPVILPVAEWEQFAIRQQAESAANALGADAVSMTC